MLFEYFYILIVLSLLYELFSKCLNKWQINILCKIEIFIICERNFIEFDKFSLIIICIERRIEYDCIEINAKLYSTMLKMVNCLMKAQHFKRLCIYSGKFQFYKMLHLLLQLLIKWALQKNCKNKLQSGIKRRTI